jgi:putative membrane protein insertion efficiency factor
MRRLEIALVRLARLLLMPFVTMTSLTPRVCKYEPTCSRYAEEAIRTHGPLRGPALALWRLLRCNPWSRGGYDPVPARRGRPAERTP